VLSGLQAADHDHHKIVEVVCDAAAELPACVENPEHARSIRGWTSLEEE
jgi:hypothetical protein